MVCSHDKSVTIFRGGLVPHIKVLCQGLFEPQVSATTSKDIEYRHLTIIRQVKSHMFEQFSTRKPANNNQRC